MRVRTYLRAIRRGGGLSISDVAAATGLARGEVSMLERGHTLPRDDQAERMAAVYGDPAGWYPAGVARVLADDVQPCPGCGDDLDPGASRRRIFHNDTCRRRARTSKIGADGVSSPETREAPLAGASATVTRTPGGRLPAPADGGR